MRLVVSDANIFIDLESGGLLEPVFQLSFDIAVPDVLYMEELREQHAELPGLGLKIIPLTAESVGNVELLGKRYRKPSRNDLFALALAQQEQCHLLSGDSDLRDAAKGEGIEVHGTLWLIGQLHKKLGLDLDVIEKAYENMRNDGRRLPWDEVAGQIRRFRKHRAR